MTTPENNKIQKSVLTADTHQEAVIHFIQTFDLEMLTAILDEDGIYMNNHKESFLKMLDISFGKFRDRGDTMLIMEKGRCNHCKYSGGSYTFIGNNSRNYLEIIITKLEGDEETSIQECYCYPPETGNPYGGNRIYVDPSHGSPF